MSGELHFCNEIAKYTELDDFSVVSSLETALVYLLGTDMQPEDEGASEVVASGVVLYALYLDILKRANVEPLSMDQIVMERMRVKF